jgi:hypothetical protein
MVTNGGGRLSEEDPTLRASLMYKAKYCSFGDLKKMEREF